MAEAVADPNMHDVTKSAYKDNSVIIPREMLYN